MYAVPVAGSPDSSMDSKKLTSDDGGTLTSLLWCCSHCTYTYCGDVRAATKAAEDRVTTTATKHLARNM